MQENSNESARPLPDPDDGRIAIRTDERVVALVLVAFESARAVLCPRALVAFEVPKQRVLVGGRHGQTPPSAASGCNVGAVIERW